MSSSHTPLEHSARKHKGRQSKQVDLKILIIFLQKKTKAILMIVSKT